MKCFCIIFWTILFGGRKPLAAVNEGLSATDIIIKHGYTVEIFSNLSTEDHYLLDVYRIPHGKLLKNNNNSRPVAFLMHGLMGTSRDFLLAGPEKGLAYLLAERGYDVWLGNARGTKYSRKHLVLDPDKDAKFWDFSWHEIGVYDLPAIFALIKTVTQKQRITYIGFSQGTTSFYVLTSLKPEYNDFITVMISLAPVAYQKYYSSPIFRFVAKFESTLTPLLRLMGVNEFPPKFMAKQLALAAQTFCPMQGFFQDICASIIFLIGGYNPSQLNKTIVPEIFNGGTSVSARQSLHYFQAVNSGEFRQFDFGPSINLKKYGSPEPPSYDLSKIVAPIALFYSEGDWIAQPKDVERLYRELPNCVYKYQVPYPQFSHYDFLYANDVIELLYNKVFNVLDKYKNHVR